MAEIVIKKRLSLDFLGEENKDDYLVFRSVPVIQYDDMVNKITGVKKGDNKGATLVMLDILKEYLLEGKYGGEAVDKASLNGLDGAVIVRCFETLTGKPLTGEDGATLDPKGHEPLTKPSTTEPQPQESS